jgi:pyridoxal phosphate enzyme (YggS family)
MNNLKENLHNIRSRVDLACRTAGRSASEVTVLAVSKRHTVDRIEALHGLGQTSFGENYVQEALDKMDHLSALDIEWHFIGPLQSNKTRAAAEHFDWVQTVDREKILKRLSAQRPPRMPPLNVCIQVNIDRELQKAGVLPEETAALARTCSDMRGVRLRGLMCIPQIGSAAHDPAESYAKMHELYRKLLATGLELDTLSMGMSADLEPAIANGSTMVRIGTDLLGPRPAAERPSC